ncbi:FUSC family protein [Mycobacterium sp. SMC-4]|uniref:FUSC family protein n=1 Tax=Mycobacterium sp. SMC-4 TaxID=2857059 RepID=UPI0021B4ABCA|nr:FUSC family protein [Mycobacterium sp. SMC-4]UXA18457.1 FUSC family protein [Mycobacterium sp. SMC-4]
MGVRRLGTGSTMITGEQCRRAGQRVRDAWPALAQAAIAAGMAHLIAWAVMGREDAFFAPVAAVLCLSVATGRRLLRAVQVVVGVALGVTIGDLLVRLLGTGPAQIALVVLLAAGAAVAVGGGPLLVNQAAVAALLLILLEPPAGPALWQRPVDALIGGATALVVAAVGARNPRRSLARATGPLFGDLAAVLRMAADMLASGDQQRLDAALVSARALDRRLENFTGALAAAAEAVRLSGRRTAPDWLDRYRSAAHRIDMTVLDGRTIIRATANAIRHGHAVPAPLVEAVRDLARALEGLPAYLEGSAGPDDVRMLARRAATTASGVIIRPHSLTSSVLVGAIRSTALDVLYGSGLDQPSALRELEDAAGRASDLR